jgi:hypothetical protein
MRRRLGLLLAGVAFVLLRGLSDLQGHSSSARLTAHCGEAG